MNPKTSKKAMHPVLVFLIEVFSVRAGLHVKQPYHNLIRDKHRA